MNCHADKWNRKDRPPEETVASIRSILDEIGISTKIVDEKYYGDYWYSYRVEIEGFTGIGANGKGITKEYALASAYGEFMERLESGFLLDPFFKNKKEAVMNPSANISYLKNHNIFEQYFNILSCNDLTSLADKVGGLSELETYYDLSTGKQIKLPTALINILCGSNGLCAGNTYEEAFAQGIAELFERHVIKHIYWADYNDSFFYRVDEAVYRHTNSYELIKAIEAKGYIIYIIDCTMNGSVPVLGVYIMDKAMTSYYFKMGSDLDLDICIQRCITEVFQGLSFDINFRANMNDVLYSTQEGSFEEPGELLQEYMKTIISGNGRLPRRFLKNLKNITNELYGFIESNDNSNAVVANRMLNIAKGLGNQVLITDYGYLGFPALRVFIPSYSEAFYPANDDIGKVFDNYRNIRMHLKNGNFCQEEVLNHILELMSFSGYQNGFDSRKIFGIIAKDYNGIEYLNDPYYLIAALALYCGNYELAYQYIQQTQFDNKRTKALFILLIEAIMKGCDKEEFMRYASSVMRDETFFKYIDNIYNIQKNGFYAYCSKCGICEFRSNCLYEAYARILNNLSSRKRRVSMKAFDHFCKSIG